MLRDHIVCLAYRAQNWVLGDSEEIPHAGVVQPRSGVLSIVVGLTVRGARVWVTYVRPQTICNVSR